MYPDKINNGNGHIMKRPPEKKWPLPNLKEWFDDATAIYPKPRQQKTYWLFVGRIFSDPDKNIIHKRSGTKICNKIKTDNQTGKINYINNPLRGMCLLPHIW